jgi:hypothetical protein
VGVFQWAEDLKRRYAKSADERLGVSYRFRGPRRLGFRILTLGANRLRYRPLSFAKSSIADVPGAMGQTEGAWLHSLHLAICSGFLSPVFKDLVCLEK